MTPVLKSTEAGCLFVVATPIGNLDDMTLRAVKTLQAADLILAEDTRVSRRLLEHYAITSPMLSYHEHNEVARLPELLERLANGQQLALISDAGTPAVSDPGYRLVKAIVEAGMKVVPLPGPCAAITALSAAGLPSNNFAFIGFAPKKNKARLDFLQKYAVFPGTLIFYESPHRILDLLLALQRVFGAKPAVVARELTKIYEEFLRGSLNEILDTLAARPPLKGECVVLLDNSQAESAAADPAVLTVEISEALSNGDLSASALAKTLAQKYNLPKAEIYQQILQVKNNDV